MAETQEEKGSAARSKFGLHFTCNVGLFQHNFSIIKMSTKTIKSIHGHRHSRSSLRPRAASRSCRRMIDAYGHHSSTSGARISKRKRIGDRPRSICPRRSVFNWKRIDLVRWWWWLVSAGGDGGGTSWVHYYHWLRLHVHSG